MEGRCNVHQELALCVVVKREEGTEIEIERQREGERHKTERYREKERESS